MLSLQEITINMSMRGHNLTEYRAGAVVCAISVESDGYIYANSDFRKSGDVAGLDPVS